MGDFLSNGGVEPSERRDRGRRKVGSKIQPAKGITPFIMEEIDEPGRRDFPRLPPLNQVPPGRAVEGLSHKGIL